MNLMNHFKVSHRIVLLGLIAVLTAALPLFLYVRGKLDAVDAATREREGLTSIRALHQVIKQTQLHRGLVALTLSGDTHAPVQQGAAVALLEQSRAQTSNALALLGTPAAQEQWQQASRLWSGLREKLASKSLSSEQSFAAHTALLDQLLQVYGAILDDSALLLAPTLDSLYLIRATTGELLYLIETLGRDRDLAAPQLAAKTASGAQREGLRLLSAQAREFRTRAASGFGAALAKNEYARQRLSPALQAMLQSSQKAIALTDEAFPSADALIYPADQYFKNMTQFLESSYALQEQALVLVEEMLSQRLAQLRTHLAIFSGVVALFALLGVLFSWLTTRSITHQIGGEPAEVVDWVDVIANGDLSSNLKHSRATAGSIVHAVATMQANLQKMVLEVRANSEHVVSASGEIAAGNMDLSERTERQASALEETSSSTEQLMATVQQNADNARQANALAKSASEIVAQGGQQVAQVVGTMHDIDQAAQRIGDIIGVIDSIAFQTNILALNAAVEAARAGDQGRGFAVVATEVRSLAQRSAVAAKEIKALIGDSISKVQEGSRLVDEAGATMEQVVSSVMRVTDIMGEVTASSLEQSSGIEQVNQAIVQMDQLTQQNAALVEQASAAAAALKNRALDLQNMFSMFKLKQVQVESPSAAPASASVRSPSLSTPAPNKSTAARLGTGNARLSIVPPPKARARLASSATAAKAPDASDSASALASTLKSGEWEAF